MKLCELHTERTETARQWRPSGARKFESNHLCRPLSFLLFCPCASHHLSPLALQLGLSLALCLPVWARGAVQKRMSPLSQCYIGEIDSLASVLSAAICWCFHIPEKWGEGVIKAAKVKITTLAISGEERERPLLSHHERSIPQSCREPRAPEALTPAFHRELDVFFSHCSAGRSFSLIHGICGGFTFLSNIHSGGRGAVHSLGWLRLQETSPRSSARAVQL